MSRLQTVAIDDYRVTYTMACGPARRTFVMQIPAASEEHARNGALDFAYAIAEATRGIWKMTDKVTVEAVAG